MKILLTGASGRAGKYITADLLEHGYEVVACDKVPPAGQQRGPGYVFKFVEATELAQVLDAMKGCDAVIHMAAIPNPIMAPEAEVFRVNMLSNWAVLEAAEILGIRKVVMASSINAVGAVFSKGVTPRPYFPIDEEQETYCEDAYSQSKWLGEEMALAFCRRRDLQIASMRFHGLWDRERQAEWNKGAGKKGVGGSNAKHFWGWTDIAEAARACVLAIEKDWTGHEAFFINGNDSALAVPTIDAVKEFYPEAEIRGDLSGNQSAISNEKSKRILGLKVKATWRDA